MTIRSVVFFTALLLFATTAQAGNQLFEGSWTVKAFGNECSLATSGGARPHCGNGAPESEFYSGFGMPQAIQCNDRQPRCPFESTPTNGTGKFAPLGGSQASALFCAPWANWGDNGTTVRPAKGMTLTTGGKHPIPPLYRNPRFFSAAGQPGITFCTASSTGWTPNGKGKVQAGNPVTGRWGATTAGAAAGSFEFGAAPAANGGVRVDGVVGSLGGTDHFVYRYTYATLRNDAGFFGPGQGRGSFNIKYKQGLNTVASITVKQGAAKFGGTMAMLGSLTSKACYYRNGGCSLGENNWRYDAIGTTVPNYSGVVTMGYVATYKAYYYNTALHQTNTVYVEGSRFPWTTGSVTVTAVGRGTRKTVHYAQGYDNRFTSTMGGAKGTIQLVTPVLTRWLRPTTGSYETAGIGILKIKFVPEPQTWVMLVAGVALLGVGYRMRGR